MLPATLPPLLAPSPDILSLACEGVSGQTLRAYQADWRHYAAWCGQSVEVAVQSLVMSGHGNAQRMLYAYRQAMISAGTAPATINRHLSSLRYVVRCARRAGVIEWALDVQGVRSSKVKDTRGPGAEIVEAMLEASVSPQERLLILLLHDMGLRRAEVAGLALASYARAPEGYVLQVKGKGRLETEALTIPSRVRSEIEAWLAIRGVVPGSLLGISYHNVPRALKRIAIRARAQARVNPHGFRHTAITKALDVTNGNIRAVQKFARHSRIETTMLYDDAREDMYGQVANMVGGMEK